MLSFYFKKQTSTERFKKYLLEIIKKLEGKRIVLYGVGNGFLFLNEHYDLINKLNIIAFADKVFEKNNTDNFMGIKSIKPSEITNIDFDKILVSNEQSMNIVNYLVNNLRIDDDKIDVIFKEEIPNEISFCHYLCEYEFEKHLEKLKKKLKNKRLLIYGAGIFFETIHKFFDLEGLNIIGIADKKFEHKKENETFLGYKAYAPSEIKKVNPDYVLVATKFFVDVIEDLHYNVLSNTRIKVKPLMKKPLAILIKEIWG